MKSTYDQAQDTLEIDLSDGRAVAERERPDELTTLGYSGDRELLNIRLAQARRRGLVPVRTEQKAPVTVGWRAIRAFYQEYSWVTRGLTVLLVAAALLNILKDVPCPFGAACLPAAWVNPLSGDGMMTLLTLAVAFGVGVHIKLRLERGLVDGAEHYSIGRALAYGYFSNFLLIALMQLRAESMARGLPRGRMLKLKVVFPATPADLEAFRKEVTQSNHKIESRRITAPQGSSKVLQRQMLVICSAADDGSALPDMFIDFPTTLYTMQDYFQTWDVWLSDRGRGALGPEETERLYRNQIDQFFDHLADLSHDEFGLAAARRAGFDQVSADELASVFSEHMERVEGSVLVRELQARQASG
ncbi:STING domain-containing protein [Variovorax sp. OV329]|uniref:STING domain-containing protein n=1 Tax=Variovorax sp. OV329 TaxID=1882825 RepID=UPI0008DEBE1A|nr:STING domain-containing protein [Variovorax sp. OV329]SFL89530.1 hypothetical protein SAMN05444747_101170 [Variovorax sp. OV329]